MTGRVVETHAAYEARNPDELEWAREYEQHRRHQWELWHGTVEGYAPTREFPCLGALRVVDENGSHLTICCDKCGFETTCRSMRWTEQGGSR